MTAHSDLNPKAIDMQENSNLPEADAQSPIWRRLLIPGVLLAAAVLIYATGLHEQLSYLAFLENRADLIGYVEQNLILAVLSFALLYIITVALSLPGASFLTITGGFLFGWLIGGVATVVGATIGATAIFIAAKTLFGSWFEEKCGSFIQKIGSGFRENAFSYMLFLRLVPLFPFFAVNVAPAFFNVTLRSYVLATFIGIIPGTFAFAFLGVGLGSVFETQHNDYLSCASANGAENCSVAFDISTIVTPELLIAFTLLGVVALIPVVIKQFRR